MVKLVSQTGFKKKTVLITAGHYFLEADSIWIFFIFIF